MEIELEGVVRATGPGRMVIAKERVRYWFVKNAKLVEVENCEALKAMGKGERRKLHGKHVKIVIEIEGVEA
ncbi:MAG: hypothetical protein QXJ17_04365 [Nitrososphaeria archaeon]